MALVRRRGEAALAGVLFCYGSNLDPDQLRRRCPRAVPMGRAKLVGYRLAFGGYSVAWRGAVANVVEAMDSVVEGCLYFVVRDELRAMDAREGVPFAYERIRRRVTCEFGVQHNAFVYVQAGDDFEPEAPSAGYFDVLWNAYVANGFDRAALALAEGITRPGTTHERGGQPLRSDDSGKRKRRR